MHNERRTVLTMGKRARILNVMQYERHPWPEKEDDFEPWPNPVLGPWREGEEPVSLIGPRRGRVLLTEDRIEHVVNKYRSIKQWAWIKHDRDPYTAREVKEDATGRKQPGCIKAAHFHLVIKAANAIELETVAGWLGINANYIDVPKGGERAFLDCVQYLTHESQKQQDLGKFHYPDSDVHSNFEWREALNKRAENQAFEGVSARDALRLKVRTGLLTLDQAYEADPVTYNGDMTTLQKLRTEYLRRQPPPSARVNYYISGRGGAGKGLLARALARSLYPGFRDDECFFEVGGKNVPFEGYRGQPVLIWNDWRAWDFLTEFGGRGNVFRLFDPHPGSAMTANIKNSSVVLNNEVNIVASEPSHVEFLDKLAGSYTDKEGKKHESEDKGQAYRRWPVLIPMHEEDFDILLNRGWLNESDEFTQYVGFKTVTANMRRVRQTLRDAEQIAAIEGRIVSPVVDAHRRVTSGGVPMDELDPSVLASYGSTADLLSDDDMQLELDLADMPRREIERENAREQFEQERRDRMSDQIELENLRRQADRLRSILTPQQWEELQRPQPFEWPPGV